MRNREPRLTVRALRPVMSGLMTLGYDPVPFLHTQGIDSELLLDPDATVPMSVCVGLLAEGARATGDDNLGLHVAERAELGSFDLHFYAMISSPTLGAAFERVCRYHRLIHETSQVQLEKSGTIVWSRRAFQAAGTPITPFTVSKALIHHGLYRWSRNPMYLGAILLVAGVAILLGSLSPLLVVIAFFAILQEGFVRREERLLDETFGDRYRAYRRSVRRWL